jgi:S1-C subfamily serine protease
VALDQQITATDESGQDAETLTGMIQIAASVQPGQSGGAVVNADGEVVGDDHRRFR